MKHYILTLALLFAIVKANQPNSDGWSIIDETSGEPLSNDDDVPLVQNAMQISGTNDEHRSGDLPAYSRELPVTESHTPLYTVPSPLAPAHLANPNDVEMQVLGNEHQSEEPQQIQVATSQQAAMRRNRITKYMYAISLALVCLGISIPAILWIGHLLYLRSLQSMQENGQNPQ
jgi:hypothetical protein